MIRKTIQLFIMMLFIISCATAQPEKEVHTNIFNSADMSLEDHFEMENKWQNLNINTYKMEISYNSFSSRKGIWIIKIINGVLTDWETKNKINHEADKEFAATLTQKNLFILAENAYIPIGSNPGYITTAIYDKKGYIREINFKQNNPNVNLKPTDKGFRIKILNLYF